MASSEKRVAKLEERLRHWGAKLDELVTKADRIDAEAKLEYHERVDEFRAKQRKAQLLLAELDAAGSEKWKYLRSGIESSWSELESAFKELKHQSKR
jgi:hypothetical protein